MDEVIKMILEWARGFIRQKESEVKDAPSTPPRPGSPPPPTPTTGTSGGNNNPASICDDPVVQGRKGKILIWDHNESHGNDVRNVFLGSYVDAASRITMQIGWNFSDVEPYDLVLKSTSGFERQLPLAEKYPETCFIMPVGSNHDKEMTFLNNNVGKIVLTRTYEPDDKVGTAYGGVLEFWEKDHKDDEKAVSSYGNALVAAKLLKIWEARGGCWEDTRSAARNTAYRDNNTHPNGEKWNKKFGFGQIRINEAILW